MSVSFLFFLLLSTSLTHALIWTGYPFRRIGILQSLVNQTQNVATVEQTPLWHQVGASKKSKNLSRRGFMYYNRGGEGVDDLARRKGVVV